MNIEELKEHIQIEVLGLCGCGNPDDITIWIGEMLKKLDSQNWGEYSDMPYMFFVYWANDKNFAEHGTTVRCSWLTESGKKLLNDIKSTFGKDGQL